MQHPYWRLSVIVQRRDGKGKGYYEHRVTLDAAIARMQQLAEQHQMSISGGCVDSTPERARYEFRAEQGGRRFEARIEVVP